MTATTATQNIERAIAAIRRRYLPPTRGVYRFLAVFSWFRAKLFGLAFAVLGQGITITPTGAKPTDALPLGSRLALPDGPLIVVANHRSHADSAALLTTIGRQRPVLVVADAEYWLASPIGELLSRTLVGVWPIRRDSEVAYNDLSAAAELVRAGVVLVLFPEGTRTRDGKLGRLRSGAFRLAQETGAAVLPIAITGTERAMPVNGGFINRAPVSLALGEALQVGPTQDDVDFARIQTASQLTLLTRNEPVSQPGIGWKRVRRAAYGWVGPLIVFLWAFGEGNVWPLIAEMPLLLMVGAVGLRWRTLWLITLSAAGSVLGVIFTWYLTVHGTPVWEPFTTHNMYVEAHRQLATNLNGAFANQMWNGIPVKVYAHEAGTLGLNLPTLLSALGPRIARIALVGGVGALGGQIMGRWLKPCLGTIQLVSLALFPLGLAMSIAYWSVNR
jgi:1-acyl-sn-glycerol-3-phosphate acyltransferase